MKFPTFIDRKAAFVSIIFVAGLFCFELLILSGCRKQLTDYANNVVVNKSGLLLFANVFKISIGFLFVMFFSTIYFYLSFTAKIPVRAICLLIFSISVFFEYTYLDIFSRFSTINDIKNAISTTQEQAVYAVFNYINLSAFFPVIIYAILLLVIQPKLIIKRQILLFPVAFMVLNVSLFCLWVYSPALFFSNKQSSSSRFPLISSNAFVRTIYGYAFFTIFNSEVERSVINKPENLKTQMPHNNVVLIVDESVKGTNLTINGYNKDTTPFLKSLETKQLLNNWKIATSGSTLSISSFNLLISGVGLHEDTEINRKVFSFPSIFQYAKAMNYKTYFLDGQLLSFWAGNYSDLNTIDSWVNTSNINPKNEEIFNNDFKIAKLVNEIITKSSGNFIVVFKMGCHTPYEKNFSADSAKWKPYQTASKFWLEPKTETNHQQFINTYDNCISFNLDTFFQTISNDYENLPNNTVILYTSDHGQNFGEDGAKRSHGGTSKVEAAVPLFALGKLPNEVDTNFKASHENIFSTLLDLMNYPMQLRKKEYAISLLKAKDSDSKPRYYFNPDLNLDEKFQFDE